MTKQIVCIGLLAMGALMAMTDQAEARRGRRQRGCSTPVYNSTPAYNSCNACVPQGGLQYDPNAPTIDQNSSPEVAPPSPPTAPAPMPNQTGNAI